MRNKIVLFIIIFIAVFLRFFHLGTNPPSLTWDEVAWGYNAYSIGIDGKDEFGRFLPYDYLESFGDFKPPVYAYLTVLPVKIFGLNEFAVRFPSALFGTLTVLMTYFLTRRIFDIKSEYRISKSETNSKAQNKNDKKVLNLVNSNFDIVSNFGFSALNLPLIAASLLAISPWHIMLSRAAFEANVATFFLVAGVWLFLEAVQRKRWLIILSVLCFVAAFNTFNTSRIVGPVLFIGLSIAFWKELFAMKKSVIIAAILGLFLMLPVLPFIFTPQASLRFKEVNIFSNIEIIIRTNQEIANDGNTWWSKILHNRRLAYGREYLNHYFDNLSPFFLFIQGDGNPKFSTQSVGQLYVFELPFLIAGILFLIRKREKNWWIIPFWLLVGIIPAATARETPHALRIETTLPMFQILVAYGIMNTFVLIKKYKNLSPITYHLFPVAFMLFAVFNIAYYLEDYYIHYPKAYSRDWQYGYKDAVAYMEKVGKEYDKIYLTKEMGRPYIYTLFYKKYDPKLFRKEAVVHRDAFGFVNVLSFNKYYFDKNALYKTAGNKILFIDSPVDVPKSSKVLRRFTTLDGKEVMVAYTL